MQHTAQRFPQSLLVLLFVALCGACAGPSASGSAADWIPLFDGESLDGWTPKIVGESLGSDRSRTFRVEDGSLKVVYDEYESFDGRFGHLFCELPWSRYRLRVEYRFVGDQVPGAPGWAFRNSGLMVHGQDPATMGLDQDFPVSIEVQLLGGDGNRERSTANLCTPGTHVVMQGELSTRHCTDSQSPTFHGDRWVAVEVEVLGHERITHYVEGLPVLSYAAPQLDPGDGDAQRLLEAGAALALARGTLSLQSEGHAVEFRRVEVLPLD